MKKIKAGEITGVSLSKDDKVTEIPVPNIEQMIMGAIEKGASVEVMEKILALSERIKANVAKEQFDKAMANFQAECPEIKKTKSVPTRSGAIAYSYAPLESIVKQVKGLLAKNGLSYSIKVKVSQGLVESTCIAKHIAGHSEESSMEVPLGNKTEVMSQTQVVAAASSFAKRYAFCNVFGIMTGDGDDEQVLASQDKQGGAQITKEDIDSAKKILGDCMTRNDLTAKWTKLSKELRANQELIKYANEIMSNIKDNEDN